MIKAVKKPETIKEAYKRISEGINLFELEFEYEWWPPTLVATVEKDDGLPQIDDWVI